MCFKVRLHDAINSKSGHARICEAFCTLLGTVVLELTVHMLHEENTMYINSTFSVHPQ